MPVHATVARPVVAVTLALAAMVVQAAPVVTYGGVADGTGGLRTAVAGTTTIDFGSTARALPATFGGVTYTSALLGGGSIAVGSVAGITAAPGLSSTSAYLTVPASDQPWLSWGVVTIGFDASYNYFGLHWGSIDAYNELAFYDGSTLLWSANGAAFADPANGCQSCGGTNRYVNLDFGAQGYDRIVMASWGRAFESDNHAYGQVPAPGALALLGIGLAAMAAARRRRA